MHSIIKVLLFATFLSISRLMFIESDLQIDHLIYRFWNTYVFDTNQPNKTARITAPTEGFLSMCGWDGENGLTIFSQLIWGTFALSLVLNRTFILPTLPASAVMRNKNEFIPFADLFDINILRKAYGPNCCISPDDIRDQNVTKASRSVRGYQGLLNEFRKNRTELNTHRHIQVCGVPFRFIAEANITSVYENTRPHPSIERTVQSALDKLHELSLGKSSNSKVPLICMHLRTEPDFMGYFHRAPAAYTQQQILVKMKLTRSRHPETTFAELWSPKNGGSKPILYLAGGNKDESRAFFNQTDWFSAVENKESILLSSKSNVQTFAQLLTMNRVPSSLLKSLDYEVSTVLALIDFEICKRADIFIGNNHSSLSERIATERQRSDRWEKNATRTLESGGKYNYMINSLRIDARSLHDLSRLDPLHPFCAANSALFLDYKCNYVAIKL